MEYNIDLFRGLLLFIEEANDGSGIMLRESLFGPLYKQYGEATVFGHLKLLKDASLIDANLKCHAGTEEEHQFTVQVKRLTLVGHEYLGVIRNNDVWKHTKGAVAKAGGWTVSLLGDIAKAYIKSELVRIGALPSS
jgi:hypothetical protein